MAHREALDDQCVTKMERHHLRLSADDLWKSWIVSREVGSSGDILRAYTPMGHVYLEEHKDTGIWIISPNWTIQRYVANTERRAIHHAVLSYLQDLRFATREFLLLTREKQEDDEAYDEMNEVIDLLYLHEG